MLRKEEDRTILTYVRTNTKRYVEMIYEIVEKNMPQRNVEINPEDVCRFSFSCLGISWKMRLKNSVVRIWWGMIRAILLKMRSFLRACIASFTSSSYIAHPNPIQSDQLVSSTLLSSAVWWSLRESSSGLMR